MVISSSNRTVDTSNYLYFDAHPFFNGQEKRLLLADVVSTCLHGSGYVYMDTRKNFHDKSGFSIYIHIETDFKSQYINVRSYVNAIMDLINDKIKERQVHIQLKK